MLAGKGHVGQHVGLGRVHIPEKAIRRIAQLYGVEAEAWGSPPERRVAIRQARIKQILKDLEPWLAAQIPTLSGKSPLATANRPALARMTRLRPCLEHDILEPDNSEPCPPSVRGQRRAPSAVCAPSLSAGRTTSSSAQRWAAAPRPSSMP
ncbi:IS66 family transposase [Rubellimicrobium aerolatum]|uniref:Transposase n=1 Tax=Rubellimicrobium aerolatum TaxID=490979 RepID=A0ABW0SDK9_9RHOB